MLNLTYKTLTEECLNSFKEWLFDKETIRYSRSIFQNFKTAQDIETWFEELLNEDVPFMQGVFLDDKFIGYAGFCNQDESCTEAEFFLFIGDKTEWGKGIGTQITNDFIQIGFDYLGWKSIFLTVSEPNQAALKLYQKVGFETEERFKGICFRDGAYHDKLLMRIFNPN
jgi:RimJ/RimL family protein N-acetyltransferase